MNQTAQFDGETYEPARDHGRLSAQLDRVRELMSDREWRSLHTISQVTGDPESSCGARVRDLRKQKFGGYTVEREWRGGGLWVYRVSKSEQ